MVSFTLDAVKFLLIYRYLQNTYWFKRGASPLPVPRVKAFALPCKSKRATLIQRQISCNIQNDKKMCVNANIYSI